MYIRRGRTTKKASSLDAVAAAIQQGKLLATDEYSNDKQSWSLLSAHPAFKEHFSPPLNTKKPAAKVPSEKAPVSEPAKAKQEEVEIASRLNRFFAFLIDMVLLYIIKVGLKQVFPELANITPQQSWIFVASLAVVYFTIFDSSIGRGVSLGKRLMSVRIIRDAGGLVSPLIAFPRSVLFFICLVSLHIYDQFTVELKRGQVEGFKYWMAAWLVFGVFFVGNFLFTLFHPQVKSLWDVLFSTTVLKKGNSNPNPIALTMGSSAGPLLAFWAVVGYSAYFFVSAGYLKTGFQEMIQEAQPSDEEELQDRYQRHMDRMTWKDDDGWTDLHRAVASGELQQVRTLIEQGGDVNQVDTEGASLLKEAARRGNLDIMNYLLDNGAKVDILDDLDFTPLHIAAEYHQIEAMQLLIDHGADVNAINAVGATPLRQAAPQEWHKDARVAEVLLKHGADFTIRSRDGCVPIYCATKAYHYPLVKYLLEQGADPNSASGGGFHILYVAVSNDQYELAELILSHGADPNLTSGDVEHPPLYKAVLNKNLAMAELLLKNKADPNNRTLKGFTPILIAVQSNNMDMTQLLLRYGANPRMTDINGDSAYKYAVKKNMQEFIDLFMKK